MNMKEFLENNPEYTEENCLEGIWHSGIPREGLYEEWRDNGQLRARSNWKNGKRHGLAEWWYDNGQIGERSNRKNGKRHGLYEEWYYDGQLRQKLNWEDDIRTEQVEEYSSSGVKYDRHYEYSPEYEYETHSEMIDNILTICLGCFTRTFDEWESDWYNNDDEFPEGAEQTKAREQVYLAHCRHWKKKSFLEKNKNKKEV